MRTSCPSSLGNGFLIVLSPPRDRGVLADEHLVSVKRRLERDLIDGLERDLKAGLLATVGLYVGHARLTQSPKVRFRRAPRGHQCGYTHHRDRAKRAASSSGPAVRRGAQQRADQLCAPTDREARWVRRHGLRATRPRAHGQRALSSRRALRRRAAAGSRCRARPPVPHGSYGLQRAAAATRVPALHQHRSAGALFHSRTRELIREFIDATPVELRQQTVIEVTENAIIEDFEHMRDVVGLLRARVPRRHRRRGSRRPGLQTMVELEADFIKLDMSLTRSIEDSMVKRRSVKTLRDFCEGADITDRGRHRDPSPARRAS